MKNTITSFIRGLLMAYLLFPVYILNAQQERTASINEMQSHVSQYVSVGPGTTEFVNGYRVARGQRPPVDLSRVKPQAIEPGKILIKIKENYSNQLRDEPIVAEKSAYVKTGIESLDALNRMYGAKSYTPLYEGLYNQWDKSHSPHRQRHKAWGFHLWFEIELESDTDIIAAVKQFAQLGEIEVAEPVYRKQLIGSTNTEDFHVHPANKSGTWTPNDPQLNNQWHYHNTGQQNGTLGADISMLQAWDIEAGHPDVVVSIQDDGIQLDHPDLAANIWSGVGFNFVNNNATIVGGNHGTHVAGTVAAVSHNGVGVAGVAGGSGTGDGVRLMSSQVFTSNSSGGFHLAPVHAADNGAAISQNSWGYTQVGNYNQSVLDAIDYFNLNGGGDVLNGGITIYAAGNDNATGDWYPGVYPGAFAVAATNNQDVKAWYSNYGPWIDVSAPGGETNQVNARGVLSTLTGSSYGYYQGTSMACPHVSGVAALVISYAYRNGLVLENDELAEILKTTTDDHYSLNGGFSDQLGTGRVNAHKALLYVQDMLSGVLNPSGFVVNASGTDEITISWTPNSDGHHVMILTSENGVFGQPIEGTTYTIGQELSGGGEVLYSGGANTFLHTDLHPATKYYYAAFSYNESNEYSSGRTTGTYTLCDVFDAYPYMQDFDAAQTVPVCWSIVDHQGNGQVWRFGNHSGGLGGSSGNYAYLDSDGYGNGNTQNTDLITPVFDFSEYTEVTLSFQHYFRQYQSTSAATLYYSIDGGESWVQMEQWTEDTANPASFNREIPEASGQSAVQFKWNYTGSWGYYWNVDDVVIDAMPAGDVNQLTLVSLPDQAGQLTGQGFYADQHQVNVTAQANEGWAFVHWRQGAEVLSEQKSFLFTMPDEPVSLEAHFEPLHDVTFQVDLQNVQGFDPEVHQIFLTGNFTNWGEPGTEDAYVLTRVSHQTTLLYENWSSYSDFGTDLAPWTTLQLTNGVTWGAEDFDFPGEGAEFAFMAFNPAQTTPSIVDNHAAVDGDKYAVAIQYQDENDNKWLISPEVEILPNAQLSFYAKSYTEQYGLERIRVLVSVAGSNPESFVLVSEGDYLEVPTQWTQFTFDLSEFEGENIHVAINYVSHDAFIFMLDAFEITANPEPESLVYSTTIPLAAGEYQYKYFSDAFGNSWDGGEWVGDPNREVEITGEVLVEDVWGNIDGNPNVMMGDINADGMVNVLDVVLLANLILDEAYHEAADFTQSGTITTSDLAALINVILGRNKSGETYESETAWIGMAEQWVQLESDGSLSVLLLEITADNVADLHPMIMDDSFLLAYRIDGNVLRTVVFAPGDTYMPEGLSDLVRFAQIPRNLQWTNLEASNFDAQEVEVLPRVSTSLQEYDEWLNTIQVYPNPASGRFYLTLDLETPATLHINLHDILGRTVLSKNQEVYAAGRHQLPFSVNLEKGIYLLRVRANHPSTHLQLFNKELKVIIE